MKILISVDIEGVAGVTHPQQVRPGNAEYEQARRWMTEETNAAFEAHLLVVLRRSSSTIHMLILEILF